MRKTRRTRALAWLAALAMLTGMIPAAQASTWLHLGENYYMELPDDFTYKTKEDDDRLLYSKKLNMTVTYARSRGGITLKQEIQSYMRKNLLDVGIKKMNGIDTAWGKENGEKQIREYAAVRGADALYRITVIRTKGNESAAKASAAFFASLQDHTLTGLKLNTAKKTVVLGKKSTFQLKAKKTPSWSKSKIKWRSSDEDVATVDEDGLVTFRGAGKCVITAEAEDGSGLEAACKIKVKKE